MARGALKTRAAALLAGLALLGPAGCSSHAVTSTPASTAAPAAPSAPAGTGAQPAPVPEPGHTVVVVMENHSFADIIGSPDAPFINMLARRGALFTRSYAVTHPSEPN